MLDNLDQNILATLTPEEREAMASDGYTDDELESLKALAADAPAGSKAESAAEASDEQEPEAQGDKAEPQNKAESQEEAAAKAAADEPQPEPSRLASPYRADLPEGFEDQQKMLVDAEADAWKKFDDGEIERSDLQAHLREIEAKRGELNALRVKAEISQEMTAQNAQNQWQATINAMVARVAKEPGGINYREDQAKAQDLDDFVKALARDPANAQRSMEWFLDEAHKRVLVLHGMNVAAPAPAAAPAVAPAKRAAPSVAMAPKTLAQVPGGDGPGDVNGDEFADIDSLEGDDFEIAIAKMSPLQRNKYLAATSHN